MEHLIKIYIERLWYASTGEFIDSALPNDIIKIRNELRKFAKELLYQCALCIDEPKEGE